jgi:hypothetical protein
MGGMWFTSLQAIGVVIIGRVLWALDPWIAEKDEIQTK